MRGQIRQCITKTCMENSIDNSCFSSPLFHSEIVLHIIRPAVVQITNSRGHLLQCSHYVPLDLPEDAKLPCVIYCHGNRFVSSFLSVLVFGCIHLCDVTAS